MFTPPRILVLGCLAVLALAACATEEPVETVDPDIPPKDSPLYWRVITGHDATTSSACVGVPITPICAIDTLLASHTRNDDRLYELVTGEQYGIPRKPGPDGTFVRYLVIDAYRLTEDTHFESGYIVTTPLYLGDLVISTIEIRGEYKKNGALAECPTRYSYDLRQDERGWWLVIEGATALAGQESDGPCYDPEL